MSPDSSEQTRDESPPTDEEGTTRRRLLAGGAASWATVALAGCPGGDTDSTPSPTATGTDTATETPTPTETATATDTETPTATPEPQPENYVVTAETGTGSVPEGVEFASSCAPTRKFVPGMMVTFMVGIYDPETGEQLTDEDLESVKVNIEGGPTVDLGWAGDDEENPAQEWGGSWTIPEDTKPGTFPYTVEVTVADGEANFHTVGILEDAFQVVAYDDPLNYVVTTETFWQGHPGPDYANGFVGACAPERQFTPELDVTFKVGIYDAESGAFVGTDQMKSVKITSPNDKFDPITLKYIPGEGENTAQQWQGKLETENLSPGTYSYEIVVTPKAEDMELKNVGIASDAFTIIQMPS